MAIKRLVGKETGQYTREQYEAVSIASPEARKQSLIGQIVIDVETDPNQPSLWLSNIAGYLNPIQGGGGTGNNAAVMPYFISNTQSYVVAQNLQGLYSYPITIEGELNVDGILIEVAGSAGGALIDVTGNITASVGLNYVVNTDVAPITITLPPLPIAGDEIGIIDGTGNASLNNITIDRNTHKIMGMDANYIMNTDRRALRMVYYNSSQGWLLTEN